MLHGFTLAQGKKLLVMDADLQHPPESVPAFLDALEELPNTPAEKIPKFALGTRYAKGFEMDKDWPFYRRVISWGARILSRPLTNAQDPMGGFFALRKDLVSPHHSYGMLYPCCNTDCLALNIRSSWLPNHSTHQGSR